MNADIENFGEMDVCPYCNHDPQLSLQTEVYLKNEIEKLKETCEWERQYNHRMELDQKEVDELRSALIDKTDGVTFSYYTEDGYFECRYCSFGWMLEEDPSADGFAMRYCPQCGHRIDQVITIDGSIQDEIEKEAE